MEGIAGFWPGCPAPTLGSGSGIRAHELLTLDRPDELPPDNRHARSRLAGTIAGRCGTENARRAHTVVVEEARGLVEDDDWLEAYLTTRESRFRTLSRSPQGPSSILGSRFR